MLFHTGLIPALLRLSHRLDVLPQVRRAELLPLGQR